MMATTIFLAAVLVRIYSIGLFPLNYDEATWTLSSINNFDSFLSVPIYCFKGYIPPLFSYLVAITSRIFSSPAHIVRIPAVLIGSFTVLSVYILAKELYGKKTGLISSGLILFLPWHVIQSMIGVSLILTPLFGCLISLALVKAIRKRSVKMFLLFCLLLATGSLYTYQSSVLYLVIFAAVIMGARKELRWLKPKTIVIGILIFLITTWPLIYSQISGKIDFLGVFYRNYQDNPFKEKVFLNLAKNFSNNIAVVYKTLFFSAKGKMLYGASLGSPLLVHWITFFIILFSLGISFWRRKIGDKIILVWLVLGFLANRLKAHNLL